MLDTHQLNVFMIAAETLNFTQAAQQLHMTQPSVSQHIQALERHFGIKLFFRAGRHIELTDAGMSLLPMARDLVSRAIHTEETMESLKGEIYGHLMVGCSTTPGKYVLPQLLATLHNNFPKVKVTCNVTSQERSIEMLSDGNIHLALASAPHVSTTAVEFLKFMTDPVVMITPNNHPWASRGEIDPEELYEGVFLFRENSSGTHTAVKDALKSIGIAVEKLNTLMTLGNSEAIALAVKEGLGVGFVSQMIVSRLVFDSVTQVKITGLRIERDILIGKHSNRPASTAQAAFWNLISDLDQSTIEKIVYQPILEPVLA